MGISDLAILGLAAWRITHMLQAERGPFALFLRLRVRLGIGHDSEGETASWPETEIGRLLRCLDCGSLWVGVGLVGLYMWQKDIALLAALPFAASAVAVIVGRWMHGDSANQNVP